MLRVVARALHFFLPELHDEPLSIWAQLAPHRYKVSIGPNTPIVLRPMNGEGRCRQKRNKVEKHTASKSPEPSYQ
jgi:hypothetical protein